MTVQTPTKGQLTEIYANGYDLSAWLSGANLPRNLAALDLTMFGNGGFEASTPGLQTGDPSFDGIHSGDANDAAATFLAAYGSDSVSMIVGLAGSAVGKPSRQFDLIETKYDIKSGYADLVKITASGSYQGQFDSGLFAHAKGAESATGNSTALDNAAATSNGYRIDVHVLSLTGNDGTHGVEPLIQSSPDNSAWSTLHTFGRESATGAFVYEGTGSVPRYLRGRWILDTGVTATFVMAVARR
jgi:hypothetical protein